MGETRVDLLHLLEDLRDAYPGSLEETILTEIVANALDSGASEIAAWADPASRSLTVTDDGSGMSRQALSRYHNLAATSKRRGASIGFAGVGIKLGLLISEEVHTETRRARSHLATSWRLTSKNRAPWRWIEPPGHQEGNGTTVRLYLNNALSELLEPGYVQTTLVRHFPALLDPYFDEILAPHYPAGVRLVVNGRPVPRSAGSGTRARIGARVGRQRKPSAVGYLVEDDDVAEDERGVAISTLGKVITRGWDWLGLAPTDADRVSGLIEVPPLVEALTLNKADFVRTGTRGSIYHAYRKALQEVVAKQLQDWGDAPRPAGARPRRTRALERDLQSVLADLTDAYPILSTLLERTPGGQRKLPFGRSVPGGEDLVALAPASALDGEGAAETHATEAAEATGDEGHATAQNASAVGTPEVPAAPAPAHLASVDLSGRRGPRRPARFALMVAFESRPDDPELGVLRESTVWVNDAHPAYRRASASRSEGYHVALAVAMTLSRLAVEPEDAHAFVTTFLAAWGAMGSGGR